MQGGIQGLGRVPELRRRILFTLFMLAVYRVGVQVPTPGIDATALAAFFERTAGTLFGMFNMFSGGAMQRMSILALGIMPYISASIILQLLTVAVPHLEALKKEGEAGRKKISQYTRYGTVALSLFQGFGIAVGLEGMTSPAGVPVVLYPGWGFRLLTALTLMAGTVFLMWLGEQITERGIGNGISLIIFAGIVARMPAAVTDTFQLMRTGELHGATVAFLLIMMPAIVAFICFMERSHRRIPIQYARRVVGRRVYGGQSSHLPLRVNTAGVIPPIFASSIMLFPATIANFIQAPWLQRISQAIVPGTFAYESIYVALIVFFCYFYTAIVFNPADIADNLKNHGGYIPGIRPGRRTSEYIDRVLTRITLVGAVYVSAICVLPSILISKLHVSFFFGGTSLLIVVGVAMDTMAQVESHLVMRNYEGFMRAGGRLRGRRG
ncbi:preprotein translocase subunit SecY [Dissulfurirhabdus thermomarina]|uniref:Protein translocase subunit SecY n=1 Tax=Dissulfurirhabdus thermomarina TaxID=1765737 RepID=A0A6N9TPG1_DISTH|nr:preprotein translocase subunit SecY [Dissulfurirhabdus thermomarina]NDY41327.1 preprotein translocase subunit SecY [Dissulfurirhabdus thermomarina]NMX23290.1 preprotein translocase subunit SecY [Dissulfurirhabdus thermomarina]